MKERIWRCGPPPHIGWWNASQGERSDSWRWWDGATWSYCLIDTDSMAIVAEYACQKAPNPYMIKWTDYWPENARVPRVDPSLRENRAIVEFINISITSPDPKLWEEAAWKDYHFKHAPAAAGSTRTVREMKERMKPGITSDVPACTQRLSGAIRVGDTDFSGAMKRNTNPNVDRRCRDKDPTCFSGARMRSNGQVPTPQIPDSRELSAAPTRELVRELFRRLG